MLYKCEKTSDENENTRELSPWRAYSFMRWVYMYIYLYSYAMTIELIEVC